MKKIFIIMFSSLLVLTGCGVDPQTNIDLFETNTDSASSIEVQVAYDGYEATLKTGSEFTIFGQTFSADLTTFQSKIISELAVLSGSLDNASDISKDDNGVSIEFALISTIFPEGETGTKTISINETGTTLTIVDSNPNDTIEVSITINLA